MADDKPAVGAQSAMLGARVPNPDDITRKFDVLLDAAGAVHPAGGGMSVSRSWDDILPHLVPKRLKDSIDGASGNNSGHIWRMGLGPFIEERVAERLMLKLKPANAEGRVNGLVEPETLMPLEDYQTALAATQKDWTIDEPEITASTI